MCNCKKDSRKKMEQKVSELKKKIEDLEKRLQKEKEFNPYFKD